MTSLMCKCALLQLGRSVPHKKYRSSSIKGWGQSVLLSFEVGWNWRTIPGEKRGAEERGTPTHHLPCQTRLFSETLSVRVTGSLQSSHNQSRPSVCSYRAVGLAHCERGYRFFPLFRSSSLTPIPTWKFVPLLFGGQGLGYTVFEVSWEREGGKGARRPHNNHERVFLLRRGT